MPDGIASAQVTPRRSQVMGEQLSMLDTMFLELEQADESAHMHIGAALIFDPLPGGGTPDIAEFRDHMRARVGILPRFAQQLSGTHAGLLNWLTWEPAQRLRPRRPRPSRDAAGAGWRGRAARVARGLLVAPAGPSPAAVGDDAARRTAGRALGAGEQDPPLPRRWRRLARHRTPAARRLAAGATAAAHPPPAGRPTRTAGTATGASGSRRAWSCAEREPVSARRGTRASRSTTCGPPSSWSSARR